MLIFRLMPYLRGMRDIGIDEAGMAEIEAEIVAHPTHPMIRGLKGARKARIQRPGMGKGAAPAWSITWRLVAIAFI
jgi:hypothetical protein